MITSLVISTMIMENIHHAAAAVATVIALSLPAAPILAGVLDADGISAQIIGKELVARRMGMKVHLRYDSDGTVTNRSPFFSGTGSWRRDGNRLCMTVAGAVLSGGWWKFAAGDLRCGEDYVIMRRDQWRWRREARRGSPSRRPCA